MPVIVLKLKALPGEGTLGPEEPKGVVRPTVSLLLADRRDRSP